MSEQMASHGLSCPNCKIDLVMSERQGVEIDYCPNVGACGSIAANWTRSSSMPRRKTSAGCRRGKRLSARTTIAAPEITVTLMGVAMEAATTAARCAISSAATSTSCVAV